MGVAVVVEHHGSERAGGDRRGLRRNRLIAMVALVAALAGAAAGAISGGLVGSDDAGTGSGSCPVLATPTGAPLRGDVPAVVEAVRPAVVTIDVSRTVFDDRGLPVFGRMAGTGFVIAEDGLIATNAHVVEGGGRVVVTLADGDVVDDASVVGTDPVHDLAVVDVHRNGLVPVEYGCSADLRVGDPVVAIGNALALGGAPTATTGIVAAVGREISTSDRTYTGLIQTDLAMNEGQSGGPLVDAEGRVVGVNAAGLTGGSHVGFAIGIDDARPVLDRLAGGGNRSRPPETGGGPAVG